MLTGLGSALGGPVRVGDGVDLLLEEWERTTRDLCCEDSMVAETSTTASGSMSLVGEREDGGLRGGGAEGRGAGRDVVTPVSALSSSMCSSRDSD